jgi:diadenosine tetraphosphate (Ap4A) HIT family hydrolase
MATSLSPNCKFCEILRGSIRARTVFEDAHSLAFWTIVLYSRDMVC